MIETIRERTFIVLLVAIVAITHFIGLQYPREVIFDEVHFGKFVTAYCCTGERIFDIHPPHAKLIIAGIGYLGGFRGGFDFDHIGEPYGEIPIGALRLFPALTALFLPIVFYKLGSELGLSRAAARLGGIVIAFDNAVLIQTRIIALDGLLLLSIFGALWLWLLAEKKSDYKQWLLFAGAGVLFGLAVGTKFTGLAVVLLTGVIVVVRLVRAPHIATVMRYVKGVALATVAGLSIYLTGWAAHFLLLRQPGPGDAWRVAEWRQPLPISFLKETATLHRIMFDANYNLKATHPYSSPWWQWPIMRKPVFYWQKDSGAAIYFIGNPVVWWGSSIMLLAALLALSSSFVNGLVHPFWRRRPHLWIPLAGFVISLLPFIRIPRALFLYHYLTPLFFALLFGLLWLDQHPLYQRPVVRKLLAIAVIIGWAAVAPLTYGIVINPTWQHFIQNLLVR